MVNQRGGSGGYGAVWSLNSEQRTSPYHPHKGPITKFHSYEKPGPAWMIVNCGACKQKWEHIKGEPWGSAPEECQ